MEQSEYIRSLFERYIAGAATEQEMEVLGDIVEQYSDEELSPVLEAVARNVQPNPALGAAYWEALFLSILNKAGETIESAPVLPVHRVHVIHKRWFRWAAAAAIIFAIVTTAIIVSNIRHSGHSELVSASNQDVKAPAANKALVTLADGRIVSLDSLNNGLLAQQGSIKLVKLADGQIAYMSSADAKGPRSGSEVIYNTISNPRGSKVIDMTLSDGSHVWLNAGSSIRFPIAFVGRERKVSITGEAYFEVAHHSNKPFYVSKGNIEVQVLGTHFNVNAYEDESGIRVTLLEGSVRVRRQDANTAGSSVVIKPGEQVVSVPSEPLTVDTLVNLQQVMAWKNGRFHFEGMDIKSVMRQLSRWYDVQVEFQAEIPYTVVAKISKDVPVSEVLRLLELTDAVHFKVEGKKIIVMK